MVFSNFRNVSLSTNFRVFRNCLVINEDEKHGEFGSKIAIYGDCPKTDKVGFLRQNLEVI